LAHHLKTRRITFVRGQSGAWISRRQTRMLMAIQLLGNNSKIFKTK
jgi:hypothetical protein